MKTLIITEKREIASDMAGQLGDSILGDDPSKLAEVAKKKGYLEGEKYIFIWAAGHLYRDKLPSEINEDYGLYKIFTNKEDYKMPQLKSEITQIADDSDFKKRQISIANEQLKRKDIDKIIIATDADAEGEGIGRDMLFKITKPPTNNILRLWNTGSFKAKEAIDKSMSELQPYDTPKYQNLYSSQQARSKIDYLFGMKITKSLVDTYQRKFYIGRVKSVILGLVGEREKEIKNFTPTEFYTLEATTKENDLKLEHFYLEETTEFDADGNEITKQTKQKRYYSNQKAHEIIDNTLKNDTTIKIKEIKTNATTSKKPLPLSFSDFVQEMKKYKVKPNKCLEILDYLRAEGFTTYPGTDGRYYAKADAQTVQEAFSVAKRYFDAKEATYSTTAPLFDDNKASKQNHNPISPTGKLPSQKDTKNWETHATIKYLKEAYEIIAKRLLASFLADDEIVKQSILLEAHPHGYLFEATGQTIKAQGWRTLLEQELKDSKIDIDGLEEGQEITIASIEKKIGTTKVPPRYTIYSLPASLVNITSVYDKLIAQEDDPNRLKELKKERLLLKNAKGIGTNRTREAILEEMIKSELLEVAQKDELRLTQSGNDLFEVLPDRLKNPAFTASFEEELEAIRRGDKSLDEVINEVDRFIMDDVVMHIVNEPNPNFIKQKPQAQKLESKCPLCDGNIVDTAQTLKCENNHYKDGQQSGCKFSIFKDQTKFFGQILTVDDLKKLLKATEATPLKGSKNGIYIDTNNPYFVKVVFENNPNELIETLKTYRLGDRFIFKEAFFEKLTKAEAKKLLEGKEVKLKRKKKDTTPYEVTVKFDNNSVVKVS